MDEDTDTLLALLSSLMEPRQLDQAILLEALVRCDGDVHRAAQSLSAEATHRLRVAAPTSSTKRKRATGLHEWLLPSPKRKSSTSLIGAPTNKESMSSYDESPEAQAGGSRPARATPSNTVGPHQPSTITDEAQSSRDTTRSRRALSSSEFMRILRPDHASEEREKVKETPPRFPPLTLATPTLIAQHTPCTLHTSVLPAELACRLFYAMLAESQNWQRNKWWLFDRVVESPHRTSFYVRQSESKDEDMHQAAQYWYNGRQVAPPPPFPPAMEAACDFIERVVNAEMRKRKRFPLEWGGETADTGENTSEQVIWRANVAASNCYEGAKESVGYHSDQLTNLGPYPTIASLSLGTSRTFRLREVVPLDEKEERSARTYNIPLQHNSLIIMHASTQEMYKHCIPPQNAIDMFHPPFPSPYDEKEDFESGFASNCRINITFRFYRPDFKASSIPKCRCGVPCILRPDMKNRYSSVDGERKDMVAKYWWTCYAGAQNDGKGCDFWKVMDVHQEGRGPFVGFSK